MSTFDIYSLNHEILYIQLFRYINYKNTTRTWEGTTTYYKTAFSNNMIRIIGIYYFTSKGIIISILLLWVF